MKILYFAWLRTQLGVGEETLELPDDVKTVEDLVTHLKARDENFDKIFSDMSSIRIAVDQEYVPLETDIQNAGEVAFFPPVTGG